MRELLAVSWTMPPVLAPRSIQVPRTLRALLVFGWRATVLTVSPETAGRFCVIDSSLESLYSDAFRLERVPSLERSLILRAMWRVCPVLQELPDRFRQWAWQAVRRGRRLLSAERFEVMITFAQPWSSHLVGLALSREFKVPWVAHFSDPWVDSPYFPNRWLPRLACRRWEQAVIREADGVVFTNSQTVDLIMQKYPADWRAKAHIIPHGYERGILVPEMLSSPSSCLRLTYTGSFYGMRTPVPLLRGLRLLSDTTPLAGRVKAVFIGPMIDEYRETAKRFGLSGIVEFQGPLPFVETQRAAAESDVLVVIDAPSLSSSVFLPSKLVDYLALGKPILGITPLKGASADLLRRLECPVVSPDDVAGIAGAIHSLLEGKRSGPLGVSPKFSEVAAEYDVRRTTEKLADILERVISGTHSDGKGDPRGSDISGEGRQGVFVAASHTDQRPEHEEPPP